MSSVYEWLPKAGSLVGSSCNCVTTCGNRQVTYATENFEHVLPCALPRKPEKASVDSKETAESMEGVVDVVPIATVELGQI